MDRPNADMASLGVISDAQYRDVVTPDIGLFGPNFTDQQKAALTQEYGQTPVTNPDVALAVSALS